eukprot:6857706-Pyramimonas_sp.AAC.1
MEGREGAPDAMAPGARETPRASMFKASIALASSSGSPAVDPEPSTQPFFWPDEVIDLEFDLESMSPCRNSKGSRGLGPRFAIRNQQ